MTVEEVLVPTRSCGECTVCCVSLTIDDPALQKAQGYRCHNLALNGGCAIYQTRPETCSTFYCGWRKLKWVRETLRPDVSGVLVRLHAQRTRETGVDEMGVIFTLLTRAAWRAEGLAESIAAAVNANIPVFLNVPGPPGRTSAIAKVNDALIHAVVTKDKQAILDILRAAYAKGKKGETRPIVFRRNESGEVQAEIG